MLLFNNQDKLEYRHNCPACNGKPLYNEPCGMCEYPLEEIQSIQKRVDEFNNAIKKVKELENALEYLLNTIESLLEGDQVRNMDEVILYAKNTLNKGER